MLTTEQQIDVLKSKRRTIRRLREQQQMGTLDDRGRKLLSNLVEQVRGLRQVLVQKLRTA